MQPNNSIIAGSIPGEILQKIIADGAQRTGLDHQNIQVVRAEAVTWRDSSLGCPKPGRFYAQALEEGYWVVLQIEGKYYDYRVTASGHLTLCGGKPKISISPPNNTLLDK